MTSPRCRNLLLPDDGTDLEQCKREAIYARPGCPPSLCAACYRELPERHRADYVRIDGNEPTHPNLNAVDPTRELPAVRCTQWGRAAAIVIVFAAATAALIRFFGGF